MCYVRKRCFYFTSLQNLKDSLSAQLSTPSVIYWSVIRFIFDDAICMSAIFLQIVKRYVLTCHFTHEIEPFIHGEEK